MDIQTTKQKIIYEQKQEMDQKRKNFSKRSSNKSLKEKIDENNEMIIISKKHLIIKTILFYI